MKNISIPKGMRGFILPLSFLGKLRLCTWQILFLLFFISLQAQAQQSDLLTLNMKNVTLKQFVEAVQTQSGYSFLYKDNQLKTNQRITVSVNKQSINVALEQAFKGKGISWKIQGKHSPFGYIQRFTDLFIAHVVFFCHTINNSGFLRQLPDSLLHTFFHIFLE